MRTPLALPIVSLSLILSACLHDDARGDLTGPWHGETEETIHHARPPRTTHDRYKESITLEPHAEDDERVIVRYSPTCAIEGVPLGARRVRFEPRQCDLWSEVGERTMILSGEASLGEDGALELVLQGELLEVRAREVVLEARVVLVFRGHR